jgi:integrase
MPLTDTAVRQAKPKEKDYKLSDEKGLFLLVKTNGSKYWRLKYRYLGSEKLLALGVYPDVKLAVARLKANEARQHLLDGVDPGELRKIKKAAKYEAAENSFRAVGLEWFSKQKLKWSDAHSDKTMWMLERNLFPWLGDRPISEIKSPELLATLRRIESRGAHDTAQRAKQVAGQVFRFAVATGRAERDPSQDLRGALTPAIKTHLAALTDPKEVATLLKAIDGFYGTPVVRAALRLSPLLFVRPGELRHMEWSEINWDEERWEIPAEKMKLRLPHIVPLCTQALEILRELQPFTGRGKYVFPGARGASRPLSENAVRVALRTLGFTNEQMTPHGFRAMARTILDEVLGYRVDWIEHQLAHAVKDANGRAYNRTSHLKDRKKMMQGWADYLDSLKSGSNVVPVNFSRR